MAMAGTFPAVFNIVEGSLGRQGMGLNVVSCRSDWVEKNVLVAECNLNRYSSLKV